MRAEGKSLDAIAAVLGVGRTTVSRAFAKHPELVEEARQAARRSDLASA